MMAYCVASGLETAFLLPLNRAVNAANFGNRALGPRCGASGRRDSHLHKRRCQNKSLVRNITL